MLPGAIYSFGVAVLMFAAEWIVSYFTTGAGSTSIYAAIIVATVPVVIKMVVEAIGTQPGMASRGLESAQRGYVSRVLWG